MAEAIRRAPAAKGKIFVVNLSGRGDKDIDIYRENFTELDALMTRIGRAVRTPPRAKAARA